MKGIKILLLIFMSQAAHAELPSCKTYPFLNTGFDMQAYSACKKAFKRCHSQGGIPNLKCVEKIVAASPNCKQLLALSQALESSPATITAYRSEAGYTLINQTFIADGKDNYYILSPKPCLINTVVDPRLLHPQLQTQYENFNFIITNTGMPIAAKESGDERQFIVTLKINKGCLACETLGYAIIKYTFDAQGDLKSTVLKRFTEEEVPQQNKQKN